MNATIPAGSGDGPAPEESWETDWYEQRRFELVAAMLPREFYLDAFDPACGTGELSAILAARCEYLLASDCGEDEVRRATQRLAGFNADVTRMDVRHEWPERRYDLVVLVELLPYLETAEIDAVLHRSAAHLLPGGHLVVGQWRRPVVDGGLDGDEISARARSLQGTRPLARYEDADYVIDVLGHQDAATLPTEEGLPYD